MRAVWLTILLLVSQECSSQDEDDEGPYLGKFIGKLNSYHHQVSGDVYAVDDWTILLVNFNYDGTGDDAFFWAGDSGRPGPQGFIIPDEHGKTNVLERYLDARVRLSLPDGKRVSRLRWLAVWDLRAQQAYADVLLPDEFDPPAPRRAAPLLPAAGSTAASSGPLQLLDSATILIPELRYDGSGGEVYFWMGGGPQPSPAGTKVPDEYGFLEPLRAYNGTDVRLVLAGGAQLRRAAWLALWDAAAQRALAAALLPAQPNVPAALRAERNYRSSLPNCRQLHRSVQVSWEVFGNAITIQLAAQLADHEYVSFGLAGPAGGMLGGDVAVAWFDTLTQRPVAADYNISAVAACVQVLGQWRGVCRDDLLGGQDSNQVLSGSRQDQLTVVTYRRDLKPTEAMDAEWPLGAPAQVIWAVGARDVTDAPRYHRLSALRPLAINLAPPQPTNDCVPFTTLSAAAAAPWETPELFDPALRSFRCSLGPAGGARGYAARRWVRAAPPRVWFVNGQLAPDLQLRRGLTYDFLVSGGDEPHSADLYHPLMISSSPRGGLETLPEKEQRAEGDRALAGVARGRRRLQPTAAGPLCIAERGPGADRRRDDDYASFRDFNRTLRYRCAPGAARRLTVQPDTSWPDLVYYHSFTHTDMGGRIFIVDRHKRALGRRNAAAATRPALGLAGLVALAALLLH